MLVLFFYTELMDENLVDFSTGCIISLSSSTTLSGWILEDLTLLF